MAIATANANLARQKAYNAVYGQGTTTLPVSPFHFYALKALFLHLAANKGNPDLQFIPYSAAQITTNGGYSPDIDAALIYAWYVKGVRTSGTTAAFVALHDATDNSATTTTVLTTKLNATGQSALSVYPDGFRLATELTISSATAVGGATESSAADAAVGFVIVAA